MVGDLLGYSVVRDRTVGPSRGGPREGVLGLLHGVIGAITRSNRAVSRSNRVSVWTWKTVSDGKLPPTSQRKITTTTQFERRSNNKT